jgi:hypothetical protein
MQTAEVSPLVGVGERMVSREATASQLSLGRGAIRDVLRRLRRQLPIIQSFLGRLVVL